MTADENIDKTNRAKLLRMQAKTLRDKGKYILAGRRDREAKDLEDEIGAAGNE